MEFFFLFFFIFLIFLTLLFSRFFFLTLLFSFFFLCCLWLFLFLFLSLQILHTTPLACLGDRQVEHGGDDSTINVGHVGSDSMMTQTAGPSYRHLVDLSSPDQNSLFLNPLGQSGDMFNFLYDNLLEMWSNAEYMNMGRYEDKRKDLNGNDVRYLKNRDSR